MLSEPGMVAGIVELIDESDPDAAKKAIRVFTNIYRHSLGQLCVGNLDPSAYEERYPELSASFRRIMNVLKTAENEGVAVQLIRCLESGAESYMRANLTQFPRVFSLTSCVLQQIFDALVEYINTPYVGGVAFRVAIKPLFSIGCYRRDLRPMIIQLTSKFLDHPPPNLFEHGIRSYRKVLQRNIFRFLITEKVDKKRMNLINLLIRVGIPRFRLEYLIPKPVSNVTEQGLKRPKALRENYCNDSKVRQRSVSREDDNFQPSNQILSSSDASSRCNQIMEGENMDMKENLQVGGYVSRVLSHDDSPQRAMQPHGVNGRIANCSETFPSVTETLNTDFCESNKSVVCQSFPSKQSRHNFGFNSPGDQSICLSNNSFSLPDRRGSSPNVDNKASLELRHQNLKASTSTAHYVCWNSSGTDSVVMSTVQNKRANDVVPSSICSPTHSAETYAVESAIKHDDEIQEICTYLPNAKSPNTSLNLTVDSDNGRQSASASLPEITKDPRFPKILDEILSNFKEMKGKTEEVNSSREPLMSFECVDNRKNHPQSADANLPKLSYLQSRKHSNKPFARNNEKDWSMEMVSKKPKTTNNERETWRPPRKDKKKFKKPLLPTPVLLNYNHSSVHGGYSNHQNKNSRRRSSEEFVRNRQTNNSSNYY